MSEILKWTNRKQVMDLSGDVYQLTVDYKKLLLSGIFWINSEDPAELVDELVKYRKIH
jgi:hypothetical protein